MEVKAIGDEKFSELATVSAYAIYAFRVPVNIGQENFDEWLKIYQIHQYSPLQKIFP